MVIVIIGDIVGTDDDLVEQEMFEKVDQKKNFFMKHLKWIEWKEWKRNNWF